MNLEFSTALAERFGGGKNFNGTPRGNSGVP